MKLGLLLPTVQSIELNAGALRAAEQLGADDIWVLDHMMGFTHPELWPEFPASAAPPGSRCPPRSVLRRGGSGPHHRPADRALGDRRDAPPGSRPRAGEHDAQRRLQGRVRARPRLGGGGVDRPVRLRLHAPVGNLERALGEIRSLLDSGAMPEGGGRTGLSRDSIPEVWVAAQRPRMLKLTGRYADGWIPLPSEPEEYAAQYAMVRRRPPLDAPLPRRRSAPPRSSAPRATRWRRPSRRSRS